MCHRLIAIGDIHGCSRALATLIAAIDPGADDTLVPLGDYIDRGPDSRGVLDQLLALARLCHLVPLLGNHDQMLLNALEAAPLSRNRSDHPFRQWLNFGGAATLDSYGAGNRLDLIPASHIDFLCNCLDYFESESHIFIHANYFPELPMSEQPASILRWASLRDLVPGPHRSGKLVIAGHTSQKTGEILDLGYLQCIDTYCYGGGWLTARDVLSGQTWQTNERGRLLG